MGHILSKIGAENPEDVLGAFFFTYTGGWNAAGVGDKDMGRAVKKSAG